ncbi:MAG TPA: hypothetical protein VH539_06855 [Gemmatimonadaceae bacterium]|jgi:hypothetical protein
MNEALTPLQRAVIQRLHEAGFEGLAVIANDHWSQGQPIPGIQTMSESSDRHGLRYRELLDDFDRANAQAGRASRR